MGMMQGMRMSEIHVCVSRCPCEMKTGSVYYWRSRHFGRKERGGMVPCPTRRLQPCPGTTHTPTQAPQYRQNTQPGLGTQGDLPKLRETSDGAARAPAGRTQACLECFAKTPRACVEAAPLWVNLHVPARGVLASPTHSSQGAGCPGLLRATSARTLAGEQRSRYQTFGTHCTLRKVF